MRRFPITGFFMLVLCACAPEPEVRTEYVTVTKDVDRVVQVRCEDKRGPLPDLPDDDEDLAKIDLYRPDGSFDPVSAFLLAQLYRAARPIYRSRLAADDAQIKGCTEQ